MEPREDASLSVQRVFGRDPLPEDWRCVGRWAFAAAYLADSRATAREIVRARLAGAAGLATSAAMAAGRGDADRFALVSAIARLPGAFEGGVALAERAVEEGAGELLQWGSTLRTALGSERAAYAPRFGLETFGTALLDVGQDRNVLMREAAASLDEALLSARSGCPALRTLRLFLRATLAFDANDAAKALDSPPTTPEQPAVAMLATWLVADLALAARRSVPFEAAWATAARTSGDALSRAVSGLASRAMQTRGVSEALAENPWALPLALAMTNEPEHASALLDHGVEAQTMARIGMHRAAQSWATESARIEETESRLGIVVEASSEARTGHREIEAATGLDLFAAWNATRGAEEGRSSLREAADRSLAEETNRRREVVRRAKQALQAAREAYEETIEKARERMRGAEPNEVPHAAAEVGAQRGCVFGFGAGCSVMAVYVAVGVVVGTGGVMGQIAPLVVGVAALPVAVGVMLHVAVSLRRAAATAEAGRKRSAAAAEFERVREAAERSHGLTLAHGREVLAEAEASLSALDRRVAA